jgi:Sulfotransferase family
MTATNPAGKVRLVQVLSSPHSGSTILGVILGSSPEIFYSGEMDRIPVPVWGTGLVCSCGQPTAECPFWSSVRVGFERAHDTSRLVTGQRRFEPWSALRRTLAASVFRSAALRAHARTTEALLRQVSEVAGKPIIVDSSKLAGRALVYSAARSEGFDVRYLHVVRDGQAVFASRKARLARFPETGVDPEAVSFASRAAVRWVVANITFSLLFSWRRGRYLRVRHEDFVRDPEGTLRRIEQFLGVSLASPLASLRNGAPFPVVHVPTGNRIRLTGEVRFRRESSSRSSPLPRSQQRAFWRIAGGLERLLGYGKDTSSPETAPPATPSGP